ncbi:unknown [Bacteroides sp. CAG:1076]|jgi:hypothetical protein|nr:unknown [Bacteroides sp. CAG:1076]
MKGSLTSLFMNHFFIGQNNLLFLKNKACPNFLLRKYTLE